MNTGSINIRHERNHEYEILWEIEKCLSLLKGEVIINSPSFTWSSINWRIELIYNSECQLVLFLHNNTPELTLSIVYEFGILLLDETTEKRCRVIKRNFSSSSGLEIIHKSELEKRKIELLPAGILTFSCFIVHLDTLAKPQNVKYEGYDLLSSNLESLYGCDKTSDITVVVGQEEYPVHKAILIARSNVFAAMFQHGMKEEKTRTINVVDCDPKSFTDFLLYLYTGKVENFSSDNVCHLYKTADKYNVEELKDFCVRYMKRNLSVENFFDIITLANQFNKTDIISLAQEFFNRKAQEILKRDDWEQFVKQRFSIANQLLVNIFDKVKFED